jgi:hypothetical protein
VAIGLLLVALALYGPGTRFPGWFALIPASAGALAILAGSGSGSKVSRLLETRVLVQMGKISYPLYLVHWPIHVFAIALLPHYGLAMRWLMFAMSFVSAFAIYYWIETRVRRGTYLRGDGTLIAGYLTATAIILLISTSILASDGWRFRFSPAVLRIADVAGEYDPVEKGLDYGGGMIDLWLRRVGSPTAPARWLIVGDSHAGALAKAISLWLSSRNEAGFVVYHHGCLPILNSGDAECRAFNRDVLRYVHNHQNIGAVMLVSIWRQPTEPGYTDATGRVVGKATAIVAFNTELHATLSNLHREGAKIYIWEPLPAMTGAVPNIIARNMVFGPYRSIQIDRAAHDATFEFLRRALDREDPLIARRLRPDRALCTSVSCTAAKEGQPLFEDNNHPAIGQAQFFETIIGHEMAGEQRAQDRKPVPATSVIVQRE